MNIENVISAWRKSTSDKGQWMNHWDDLSRTMTTRRQGFVTTTVDGSRRVDDIFDGTPMQAARGLANAIGGFMRPKGVPEVKIKTDDDALNDSDEAQDWLSDSDERLKNAFATPKSQFIQASGEKDLDLVVLGTACMFIGETLNKDSLLFRTISLKDATPFFSEDGVPTGIFIKRRFTVRQMETRFGIEKLSQNTREKVKLSPEMKIDVLHAILPRSESKRNPVFSRNFPIADIWIELEAKHKLQTSGFHEFPFIVPRWDTSSGEDYGRSPGMIALPAADTLQTMGETILISGQRQADPPLAVPNDGTFNVLNTFPGGLSFYDPETAAAVRGNPFFPIESSSNLSISRDMQQDTRQQVFNAFFKNILNLPIAGPQMTAFEVNERKQEFMREIGPVFGRLEADDTSPTVERGFMIMLRANAFLPIPEILQGQNIRFEYDSPIKRIRQQIEATAARLWSEEMIVLGQTNPEAIDLINVDELGRFSAEAAQIPRKIINGKDKVSEIRQARQQAAEQQAQMQQIAEGIDLANNGAEAANKIANLGG